MSARGDRFSTEIDTLLDGMVGEDDDDDGKASLLGGDQKAPMSAAKMRQSAAALSAAVGFGRGVVPTKSRVSTIEVKETGSRTQVRFQPIILRCK